MLFNTSQSIRYVLTAVILLVGADAASAAELPEVDVTDVEADEAQVNGRLDEPFWDDAPVHSRFHALGGDGGSEATRDRTEFRVAFDGRALLLGIVCYEPRMGDLIAKATERDGPAWSDDAVEVFISPNDRFYYQFAVNSKATRYDARVSRAAQDQKKALSQSRVWDGVWQAAVTQHSDRWVLEMRIPLATLDLTSAGAQRWRFNVGRTAARRKAYSSWSPVERGFHDLPRHGYLEDVRVNRNDVVVDSTELAFPPLLVGENAVDVSLPTQSEGPFIVTTSLRALADGVASPRRTESSPVHPTEGRLPVSFRVPVERPGVMHALTLKIVDPQTRRPVLLRDHLFKVPDPLDASLDWTVHYTSEQVAALSATIAVADESAHGAIQCTIWHNDELMLKQRTTVDRKGAHRITLPLDDLSPGRYQLRISAELGGIDPVTERMFFHVVRGPFDE